MIGSDTTVPVRCVSVSAHDRVVDYPTFQTDTRTDGGDLRVTRLDTEPVAVHLLVMAHYSD